jgi:hypothetical protein
MSRVVVSLAFTLAALALTAPAAGADGLPVPVDGAKNASVVQPDGDGPRYATVTDGDETTVLQIDQEGGEILRSETVDGEFVIPLVSIDGTPAGISGDGSRLVLIHPRQNFRFPREESSFVVVDIATDGKMTAQEPVILRGDFSFDAVSPDGSSLFLVEYPTRDYNDYSVREYDLARDRLLPDPVLVAHEVSPGEMRGLPQTRATSPDGAWEYTLYDGGSRARDTAFIHVLDTERGISHCIDLAMVNGNEAWRVGFELTDGGGTLDVVRGDETLAKLDTESFALTEPIAPELTVTSDGSDGPTGLAIGAIVVGSVLLVGTAFGLRRRRQTASLPPDPFGPGEPKAEEETEPERDRVAT